ncbi:MAG: YfjI family protein [Pseudomonadota bacterium]
MSNVIDALRSPQKPDADKFDWEFEPIILLGEFETPKIPAEILPTKLSGFVDNISAVLSVPSAMPVMAALGIVSAAIGKKFIVSPKPDWKEPINIYTLTAMQPASNKSQTLAYLKSPIDQWENEKEKKILPKINEAMDEIKILQAKIAKNERVIKSASSIAHEVSEAEEELIKLGKELRSKQRDMPVVPQIYVTDATPEAIADLVYQQDGRAAIISDEGGITEVLSGLYNGGNANIDIVLKGINGGSVRIKRADRNLKINPYLTVALLVQPQVLTNMADKRAFIGNGALERYLYALPIGNVGYREFKNISIDCIAQTNYENLIFNLLSIEMPDAPYCLSLSNESKEIFHSFRQEIERALRPDGELYICRQWAGKLAGYTLRLAGLMHVTQHESTVKLVIADDTMQDAIDLARLLKHHAVAAYSLMGADQTLSNARDILEWLLATSPKYFSKSTILNAFRNRKFGKKKHIDEALQLLIEHNMLSEEHADHSTRKPTVIHFVNPKIYKQPSQNL